MLRKKSTKNAFTLTELAFVIAIIIIVMIILYPLIGKIRNRTHIITCEENLEKIGLGLKLYANDNQGKFPESLGELMEKGYIAENEKVFNCPSSHHAGAVNEPDYHYVSGYTILSPSETAIVFDKTENHKDGRHVLYISGDIVWENTD